MQALSICVIHFWCMQLNSIAVRTRAFWHSHPFCRGSLFFLTARTGRTRLWSKPSGSLWASKSSAGCGRSTSGPLGRCLRGCACATVGGEPEVSYGTNDLDSQAQRREKGRGGRNGVHLRTPVSGVDAERQAHEGKGLEPVPGRQRERWQHVSGAVLRFVRQELQRRQRANGKRGRAGVGKPLLTGLTAGQMDNRASRPRGQICPRPC